MDIPGGRGRGRGRGRPWGRPRGGGAPAARPLGYIGPPEISFTRTRREWGRAQEAYAKARQDRLTHIYRTEVLHDVEMLKKPWSTNSTVIATTDRNPFDGQEFSQILAAEYNVRRTQELPLEWLKQYFVTYMRDEDESRLTAQREEFNNTHLVAWGDDKILIDPLEQLYKACYGQDTRDDSLLRTPNPPLSSLLWSYDLLKALRVRRRFADARNLNVSEAPLPDGSNFEPHNHFLAASWILHRCYIRLLHQRSLHVGSSSVGEKMLKNILSISVRFLDLETRSVPYNPKFEQQNLPEFNRITSLYHQLLDALTSIGFELQIERREGFYTGEETLFFNATTSLEEILDRTIPASLRHRHLWGDLFFQHDEFNQAMAFEHVEDKRIDKQVVLVDEKYEVFESLRTQGKFFSPVEVEIDPIPELTDEEFEKNSIPQAYTAKIAEINQLRRNLLLLRDWNQKRPWKQLYCPYKTAPGGDHGQDSEDPMVRGFHEDITEFHQHLAALYATYPQQDPSSFNPSNTANVFSSLFAVHPVASHCIPPEMQQDDWDAGCIVCMDEFDGISRKLMVQLFCNHYFHYTCVRGFWDVLDKGSFRCPLCRQNDWVLKEQAGITAEVNDVFDYEELMGRQNGTYDFNQSATYYAKESELRAMSQTYLSSRGYPSIEKIPNTRRRRYVYDGALGTNRIPEVEMAIVREYRRINDRRRRFDIEQQNDGISGLDPPDPNPDGVPPPYMPALNTFNPDAQAARDRAAQEARDRLYLEAASDEDEDVDENVDQNFRFEPMGPMDGVQGPGEGL
ncbi:uncharacterized protein RAG0_15867 [Rhynchosporium agropyri]|uniref:RING-type domain-containing protein n=1 Tax=Rhynchosporium agropyri TaxID=914238 RepID=A0A1E1LMT8_9HELO|nr:uncharacterized protein RAG0_15867 [Rhynchosporium agropyri]